MESKGALVKLGGKVWLRRGLRFFIRCGINNQKINVNNNAAESSSSSCSWHVLEGMLLQKGGGVVSWAAEEEGGGGVMRMKIVVRKSDLKHLVSSTGVSVKGVAAPQRKTATKMSSVNVNVPYSYSNSYLYSTAEQRLNNLLWKKQNVSSSSSSIAKPLKGNSHKYWSPALQSIPE